MIAHSRRYDPACNFTDVTGPIGVDDGQWHSVGDADGHYTQLTVILAVVDPLKRGTAEDQRGELEVESAFGEIRIALSGVP